MNFVGWDLEILDDVVADIQWNRINEINRSEDFFLYNPGSAGFFGEESAHHFSMRRQLTGWIWDPAGGNRTSRWNGREWDRVWFFSQAVLSRDGGGWTCEKDFPARGEDLLSHSGNYTVHGVIGNEVDFVSPLGKILNPALGMHAAGISDETEDHGVITPGSSKIKCDSICSLYEILSFFIICFWLERNYPSCLFYSSLSGFFYLTKQKNGVSQNFHDNYMIPIPARFVSWRLTWLMDQ